MSVILQNGFIGIEQDLNHPRLCWRKLAGTVTASTEEEGFDAEFAYAEELVNAWKPTAVPADWMIEFPSSAPVSYVGIGAHTLGTDGASVRLQRDGDLVTNLLTRSEEFDDAAYSKFRGTVFANTTIAPDGTATADSFIEGGTSGEHYVDRSFSVTEGDVYTFSTHVKSLSGNRVFQLRTASNAGINIINLDLSTGTVTTVASASIVSSGAVELTDGWFRVFMTITATGTGNGIFRHQLIDGSSLSAVYTGDGVSGLIFWGAQLNEGGPATYVRTAGTTASSDWHDVVSWVLPEADDAILFLFEPFEADRVRVVIGAAIAEIGYILVGRVTEFPRKARFTGLPITESQQVEYRDNTSMTGKPLGRTLQRDGLEFSVEIDNLPETFRADEWRAFREAMERGGRQFFFYAARPEKYPDEVALAWQRQPAPFDRAIPNARISGSIAMTCGGYRQP